MFQSNKSKQSLPAAVRFNPTPDVPEKGPKEQSDGFVRSLDGCTNCRARRKKCPGPRRPNVPDDACESCWKLRFECLGYPGPAPDWLRRDSPHYLEINAEMKQWIKDAKSRKNPDERLDLSKYRKLSGSGAPVLDVDGCSGDPQSSAHAFASNGLETPASGSSSRRASCTSSERVVNGTSGRRRSRQSEIPSQRVNKFYCRPNTSSSKYLPEETSGPLISKVLKMKPTPGSLSHRNSECPPSAISAPTTSLQCIPSTGSVPPPDDFHPAAHDDSHYPSSIFPSFTHDANLYPSPHAIFPRVSSSNTSERGISGDRTPTGAGVDQMLSLNAYTFDPNPPTLPTSSAQRLAPCYGSTIHYGDPGLDNYIGQPQYSSRPLYNSSISYPAYYNPFSTMPGW